MVWKPAARSPARRINPDVPGTSLAHNWQPDGVRAPDPGDPVCLAHPSRGLGGDEPPALAQAMSPLDLRREPGENASPNETASAVPATQALRPLDSTAHLWYRRGGFSQMGRVSKCRGRFPQLFSLWELCFEKAQHLHRRVGRRRPRRIVLPARSCPTRAGATPSRGQ